MSQLTPEQVDQLHDTYPDGTRVVLVYTSDEYTDLRQGARGTVTGVDDAGHIQIDWEDGSTLAMVPGRDVIAKIH